jgi:hypothetical protein
MDVKKKNNYLQYLYAGIAMDVKNQHLNSIAIVPRIRITRPICGYCIFEMALWKL